MIKILNYTPLSKGAVIGTVDVLVDDKRLPMIIRRIAHLKKGDREWFNFPQYKEDALNSSANGAPGSYIRYFEYGHAELNNKFLVALHEAVKAHLASHSVQSDIFKQPDPLESFLAPEEPMKTKEELGW